MPVHNTAGGSSIFFAKVPDFSLLCSVVCRIKNCNVNSPRSLQGIHISRETNEVGQSNSRPILKCRELIFTESNVLASPSLQDDCIYVIITFEFWQSGKLQERCQKMNLQVGNPIRVIPAVFQACFTYTIKAKLAPLWNKVGEYYIQGRDFITSTGILGAINLETNVTDDEICFAVKPLTVKMPHCTLQDFGVCPSIINHFLMDINYMISEYGVDDKWCYVLPSMKKGKVVGLMHHIPASSPFKSYADLRKYWKNNYGYRLPENGEGIVYINIFFPAIPHTIFTYPEFCIRKIDPRPVPRVDSTPVLQAFLTDIKKKMPHMCHTPLEVTRKPQYTAVTMNSAKGYIESKGHSSMTLIDRKYNVPQRIPARILVTVGENRGQPFNAQPHVSSYRPLTGQPANIKSISGYVLKMPETMSPVIPALPPSQFGYPHDGTLSQDGRQNACKESSPQCPLPYGSNTKVTPSRHQHNHQSPRQSPYAARGNHSMSVGSPSHQGLFCTPTHPYPSPANSGIYHFSQNVTPVTRMVAPGKKEQPQSAPKSARNLNHTIFSLAAELQNQSEQDNNSSPHHACMPAYRKEGGKRFGAAEQSRNLPPSLLQQMPKLPQNVENVQSGIVPRFLRREESEVAHPPAAPRPFVPIFNPKPSHSSLLDNASRYQTPQGPKIKPSFTPHKLRSVTPSALLSRVSTTPTHKPVTTLSTVELTSCEDIIPPMQDVPKQQPFPSSSTSSHQPAARQALHFGPSNTSSSKGMSKPNHPLLTASSNKLAKKRKAKDNEDVVDAKKSKPRTKPMVQENINVQLMAQNDQLSKVNSITLAAWLKEKGINVSSKDKKTDLMTKVMSFINCTAKGT